MASSNTETKKLKHYQWSLRGLLVLLTVMAVVFAVIGPAYRQRAMMDRLAAKGVTLLIDQDGLPSTRYPIQAFKVTSITIDASAQALDAEALYDLSRVGAPEWILFEGRSVNATVIGSVARQPRLKSLYFENCTLTPNAFRDLDGAAGLVTIYVDGNTALTKEHFLDLAEVLHLQELRCPHSTLTVSEAKNLARAYHLQILDLSGAQFAPGALEKLSGMPYLETLDLRGSTVKDEALRQLAYPALRSLSLDSTSITSAGLRQIGNIPRIRTLNLDSTNVDDSGIQYLKSLRELRHLDLERTQVTREMIRSLEKDLGVSVVP